jgi:hypothetical protein
VAGWHLLEKLSHQAVARGQTYLVTWPGPKYFRHFLAGREVPREAWVPLQGIARSWRTTIRRAGIEEPHRFHDVRARYVTEVAKVQPATTALYIRLATNEISDAVSQAVARRRPSKLKAVRAVR